MLGVRAGFGFFHPGVMSFDSVRCKSRGPVRLSITNQTGGPSAASPRSEQNPPLGVRPINHDRAAHQTDPLTLTLCNISMRFVVE